MSIFQSVDHIIRMENFMFIANSNRKYPRTRQDQIFRFGCNK